MGETLPPPKRARNLQAPGWPTAIGSANSLDLAGPNPLPCHSVNPMRDFALLRWPNYLYSVDRQSGRLAELGRPTAIDLFSGAGGLSLGLEQAGFDVLAAMEYDSIHAVVHR